MVETTKKASGRQSIEIQIIPESGTNVVNAVIADPSKYPEARGKANSYNCPIGPSAGVAWVLIRRSDLEKVTTSGVKTANGTTTSSTGNNPVSLRFAATGGLGRGGEDDITFPNLFIDKAYRILSGSQHDDPNAVYLMRLVDIRWFLNRWSNTNRQFNVRNPSGADADGWYLETVKFGLTAFTPHSWQEVFDILWKDCAAITQKPPTIPKDATRSKPPPLDLKLVGVNAWVSLNEILQEIGCATVYDPIKSTFSVVQLRTQQDTEIDGFGHDASVFSGGASVEPENFVVYFPAQFEEYGTERDTTAAQNWSITGAAVPVTIPSKNEGAIPGTVLPLWSRTPFRVGHQTAVNVVESVAFQLVEAWRREQSADKFSRDQIIVSGISKGVLPGPAAKRVIWRDMGPGEQGGMVTEVTNGPGMPFDAPQEAIRNVGPGGGSVQVDPTKSSLEGRQGIDIARSTFPVYPRLSQLLQIRVGRADNSEIGGGVDEEPELHLTGFLRGVAGPGSSVFGGTVHHPKQVINEETGEASGYRGSCWINVVTRVPRTSGFEPGPLVKAGQMVLGRLSGMFTFPVGDPRGLRLPLYDVDMVQGLIIDRRCVPDEDIGLETDVKFNVHQLTITKDGGLTLNEDIQGQGVILRVGGGRQFEILNVEEKEEVDPDTLQAAKKPKAVWTGQPTFGGGLHVGKRGKGFLAITNNPSELKEVENFEGEIEEELVLIDPETEDFGRWVFLPGDNKKDQRWIQPCNDPPTIKGSFLVADLSTLVAAPDDESNAHTCISLAWKGPGYTGTKSWTTYDAYSGLNFAHSLTFSNGLVMLVDGQEGPIDDSICATTSNTVCVIPDFEPFDPCAEDEEEEGGDSTEG